MVKAATMQGLVVALIIQSSRKESLHQMTLYHNAQLHLATLMLWQNSHLSKHANIEYKGISVSPFILLFQIISVSLTMVRI